MTFNFSFKSFNFFSFSFFSFAFCIKAFDGSEHSAPMELFAKEICNGGKCDSRDDIEEIVLFDVHGRSEDKQGGQEGIDPEPKRDLFASCNAEIAERAVDAMEAGQEIVCPLGTVKRIPEHTQFFEERRVFRDFVKPFRDSVHIRRANGKHEHSRYAGNKASRHIIGEVLLFAFGDDHRTHRPVCV